MSTGQCSALCNSAVLKGFVLLLWKSDLQLVLFCDVSCRTRKRWTVRQRLAAHRTRLFENNLRHPIFQRAQGHACLTKLVRGTSETISSVVLLAIAVSGFYRASASHAQSDSRYCSSRLFLSTRYRRSMLSACCRSWLPCSDSCCTFNLQGRTTPAPSELALLL